MLTRVIPAKTDCAFSFDNDAITGAYGTASAIGWTGNARGVDTCLGGRFFVQKDHGQLFSFGIYARGPTTWADADGYLPAQITSFRRAGLAVTITEFADRVVIGGNPYVAVYARVAVDNPTEHLAVADPFPSPGLVPLTHTSIRVAPHGSVAHDYVVVADRFGGSYAWPSPQALVAAGGFDAHEAHMRAYWNAQLADIAQVDVPDQALDDAYRSGFIYTMIARSGVHSNTGVNNYQAEYSHDVVGILANLFTQGEFHDAHALLLDMRDVVGAPEYVDGLWTYSWPWAIYVMKTGDLAFVKANFSTSGPAGATQPSIEASAHAIAAARTGPNGVIGPTDDVDSNGLWTVDDYEALMGLAAYRYLAHEVGNRAEAQWAGAQYTSLLTAVNTVLGQTIARYHLDYLPCSIVQPNTANRCREPRDANWAAPFLFGRWAWDAPLFGAGVSGPAAQLVDATYRYGFARLHGVLPPDTFGGYPTNWFSTAYNAGYGSGALAGTQFRDEGIRAYEFMVARTQSGPYSWWESASAPAPSPWIGSHPAAGGGASPHAWGIANANKVLLDSIVAQRADGTIVVGRGVPANWLRDGDVVDVRNFPTTNGQRIELSITTNGLAVTLTVHDANHSGVSFELPAFAGNVASASTGRIDDTTGSVELARGVSTVTVQLRHAAR